MPSRMDRYYEKHPDDLKRTNKNSKLYKDMYVKSNYDNVENLNLNVGKQIDINDVKAILEKRENDAEKDYRLVKPESEVKRRVKYYEDDPNIHDLNEMIGKAKEERVENNVRRRLDETQVLTLKDLVNQKSYADKPNLEQEEIDDLINTIYDTNLLKSDDGTGLLDSLKSTGKTVISPSIKQVLEEAKKENNEEEMDNSFFTSSLGFKPEELKNMNDTLDELKESNEKTTKFLIVLALLFIVIVIFIIVKFVL